MFAPPPRRVREPGGKPVWTFRPPHEIRERIEERVAAQGVERGGLMVWLMEVALDATDALGDDWPTLEARALADGESPGTKLGRLALVKLRSRR